LQVKKKCAFKARSAFPGFYVFELEPENPNYGPLTGTSSNRPQGTAQVSLHVACPTLANVAEFFTFADPNRL